MTARAADGTVEAIEDRSEAFWLAVQWHPEYGDDHGLFRGLVAAAALNASVDRAVATCGAAESVAAAGAVARSLPAM